MKPLSTEPEKFTLLADLGIITVPQDYNHKTHLASFRKEHKREFSYYNEDITDQHFSNPTRIPKPGEKFRVKVYKQIVSGITTSEERLTFLKSQGAVLLGAQGAALTYKQKKNQLPKGYWHTSLDEKDRLWQDAGGNHRVPRVGADSGGGFDFDLGCFEDVWSGDCTLLCFCYKE